MAIIHQCEIELHDSVYFATREIGRLYETETVLHNYALCYALGLVDSDRLQTQVSEEDSYRYFCPTQVPKYAAHLTPIKSTANLCHSRAIAVSWDGVKYLEICG